MWHFVWSDCIGFVVPTDNLDVENHIEMNSWLPVYFQSQGRESLYTTQTSQSGAKRKREQNVQG